MLNLIDLPNHVDVLDCGLCFVRLTDSMFEVRQLNKRVIKGLLTFDGYNYYYDTADLDGMHITLKFSSIYKLFSFLQNHKDGNYTDLV